MNKVILLLVNFPEILVFKKFTWSQVILQMQ